MRSPKRISERPRAPYSDITSEWLVGLTELDRPSHWRGQTEMDGVLCFIEDRLAGETWELAVSNISGLIELVLNAPTIATLEVAELAFSLEENDVSLLGARIVDFIFQLALFGELRYELPTDTEMPAAHLPGRRTRPDDYEQAIV